MKRALVLLGGLNRGGAETWMVQVLRPLREKGVQVDFLVHEHGPFQYEALATQAGARILHCGGLRCPPLYAWNLFRILRRHGSYDVFHSHVHHFSGLPLMLTAMAGVPVRLVQSHLDTRKVDAESGTRRRAYIRLMQQLIWSFATAGTAVSEHAADALFPPDWREKSNWRVMLLGIDTSPFALPVDGKALRRELNIPEAATVVGHVGRFDAQKNHGFLLRIAAEYIRQDPCAVFLLVGDGPKRASVEQQAAELGIADSVRFAGVRSDVPALMVGVMDCFVLPSLFEGLPLVVLEAQAAGLPCLLSDAIAEETDRVPELVFRESLSRSAEIWARRLQQLHNVAGPSTRVLSLVDIGQSVSGLMECYSMTEATTANPGPLLGSVGPL